MSLAWVSRVSLAWLRFLGQSGGGDSSMWHHQIPGAPEIRQNSLLHGGRGMFMAFACFCGLSLSVCCQAGGPALGEQFVFAFLKPKALPLIYALIHSLLDSKLKAKHLSLLFPRETQYLKNQDTQPHILSNLLCNSNSIRASVENKMNSTHMSN